MRRILQLIVCCSAAFTLGAQVIPDCGGENQRACSPADKEFWQTDSLACEYDLKLKTHLGHDDTCVNSQRWTLDKDYTWVGWALSEQRYNIGADLAINWVNHLGTHNSYSNYQQGFVDVISVNQFYSITDQLQAGARTIRLDPWWYYDELRLCHAESASQCKVTSPGRFFASAIREIGTWLSANPGEVIVIRMNDGDLTDHKDYINKPIETYLGSKVFNQYMKNNGYQGRWPTMREMRDSGLQVIIFSKNDYGAGWTFNFNDNFLEATRAGFHSSLYSGCSSLSTSDIFTRSSDKWALISEGRTMSDSSDQRLRFVFGDEPPGLLDEPQVTNSANCGFSNIEVDFFLRLDLGYRDEASHYGRSAGDPDLRREALIWSWQQDDFGRRGPALLDVPTGRWRSLGPANNYPFLCMKPADNGSPAQGTWRTTALSAPWNLENGNHQCAVEFGPGYKFSFPRNALQNQQALGAARGYQAVWLGYSAIPVPEPAAGPPNVRWTMKRGGTLPDPVTVKVIGTVKDPPNTFSAKFTSGSNYFSFSIASNVIQLLGTPMSISVNPIAATLDVGLYEGSIQLSEPNSSAPGGVISAVLEVQEPTTTTVSALPSSFLEPNSTSVSVTVHGKPLPAFQDSITGTVILKDTVTDPLTGRTTVEELGHAFLASPDIDSTGPENQANFTLTLPPGTHSLVASYKGDSHYSPSDSSVYSVLVRPLIKVTPSTVAFSLSGAIQTAGPWILNAANTQTNAAVSGTWSIPAASRTNTGRIPIYLNLTPAGNGSSATVTLDPAAFSSLAPGQYDLDVQFQSSDSRLAPEVCRFSLKVLGPLSTSTSQVMLTGDTLSQSVSVSGAGSMPVTVNFLQAPWLSAKLASGFTPSAVLLTANPEGMAPGDYTANVTINSPVAENPIPLTVKFHLVGLTTITTNVPGGSLLIDKQPHATPVSFYWEPGSHHNVNAASLQVQDSSTRWRFQSWSDGLAADHAVILPSNVGAALNLTANYSAEYQLTLSPTPSAGGAMSAAPSSADGFYKAGTPVSIGAQTNNGYVFLGFTGGVTGTLNPSTVVMNGPQAVGAAFSALPPKAFSVEIDTAPAGLSVIVDGVNQTGGTVFHWQGGSIHTISAPAIQSELHSSRLAFAQWSDGGAATHTVTVGGPVVVTASYAKQVQITVTAQPINAGKTGGNGWYNEQATVTITAAPQKGFLFTGFTGAPQANVNPQTFTVSGSMDIQANFAPQPPALLASPGERADTPNGGRSVIITLMNSGGPAVNAQIDSITNVKVVSGSGDVHPVSAFPMTGPTLQNGEIHAFTTLWAWPATATRVQFTVNFSTQTGYHGSTVLTMFR